MKVEKILALGMIAALGFLSDASAAPARKFSHNTRRNTAATSTARTSSMKGLSRAGTSASRARTRLAAVTTYWQQGRGVDSCTRRGVTSTGARLRRGVVAVDPKIIPYGSTVKLDGVPGTFIAADTGGAVINRTAARRTARNSEERNAIVVDIFFPTEREARAFDQRLPRFVKVSYYPPARG
jgi:3D (Asp-Asp-Asp) domain-containing protein